MTSIADGRPCACAAIGGTLGNGTGEIGGVPPGTGNPVRGNATPPAGPRGGAGIDALSSSGFAPAALR